MRRLIITAAAVLATLGPVLADGLLVPPHQAYPLPPPPYARIGNQSCAETALQLGYLTGRPGVAYAATEACLLFTRQHGVILPYDRRIVAPGLYGGLPGYGPPPWYGPYPDYGPPPLYGPPPGYGPAPYEENGR
jgi:hypothetical protein